MEISDCLHRDLVSVCSEGSDVGLVASEYDAARFCQGDDNRVDSGSTSCTSAKLGRASSDSLADDVFDEAGLEESIRVGIAPTVALK